MKDACDISGLDINKIQSEMDKIRLINAYPAPVNEIKSLKFVLFNVERGRYIDEIEVYMKYHPALKDADVIFFNELDDGMARSGNMDTTAELSKRLSMNYLFGIEFYELTRGDRKEITENSGRQNTKGFHGNAVLSRFELMDPVLLRLPVAYDWFYDEQKRLGGRIAIFAKIRVSNRLLGLVCTHLENRASPIKREEQMKYILERAKEYFGSIPVVIAGDMNTNTCNGMDNEEFIRLYEDPGSLADRLLHTEKYEPVLKMVESYGYEYKNANVEGKVTRRKPIEDKGKLRLNLDWFFIKGLKYTEPAVASTIVSLNELECEAFQHMTGKEGMEISDHNAISVKCMIEA